jgi:hypothetical protein
LQVVEILLGYDEKVLCCLYLLVHFPHPWYPTHTFIQSLLFVVVSTQFCPLFYFATIIVLRLITSTMKWKYTCIWSKCHQMRPYSVRTGSLQVTCCTILIKCDHIQFELEVCKWLVALLLYSSKYSLKGILVSHSIISKDPPPKLKNKIILYRVLVHEIYFPWHPIFVVGSIPTSPKII